jgi:simple sugar transport system ATP-binding protein
VTAALAAVRMCGIVKRFGSVHALRGADLTLMPGEVHALLGENGAGKSTLMQVLFGLQPADDGVIEVAGRPVSIPTPRAAWALGVGMVHQHFTQVPRLTVAENVWLGRPGLCYDRAGAEEAVRRIGAETGLVLDPGVPAGELPVGQRQRLEIVKALAGDVRVLILDEPTAALAPAEVTELFAALRRLAAAGVAVVLITHKLREVPAVADRVTVLRQGAVVLSGAARAYDADALARAMVGTAADLREVSEALEFRTAERAVERGAPALRVDGLLLSSCNGSPPISFEVAAGEIVGIAAVEGNGQRELMRKVAGLEPAQGCVRVSGSGMVGFVPEDRHAEGLILDFSVEENLLLGATRGLNLDCRQVRARAREAVAAFDVRTDDTTQPVRALSGGNQQKLILARVLSARPALIVAENPTRGLDVHATADVHERLRRAARDDGLGVLFHSTDLDEVLLLADRVAAMVAGRWLWVDEPVTRERVGALMLGRTA